MVGNGDSTLVGEDYEAPILGKHEGSECCVPIIPRSTPARFERQESWRIAIGDPCHRLDGVRVGRGRPSNRCLVHHARLGLNVL
jgi:hypothetical protein